MPKICKSNGCTRTVFGAQFCIVHQYLRTDKKRKVLKRTPIKKTSTKQKAILGERVKATKKDREFFSEIWEEREHIDFETGEPIFGEPLTLYFHHVLPKRAKRLGGYPEHRYKKWNIVLVTWDTHTKAENNLDLVPKIKAYTEEMKKRYT